MTKIDIQAEINNFGNCIECGKTLDSRKVKCDIRIRTGYDTFTSAFTCEDCSNLINIISKSITETAEK